jgi:geranylgeranyl pyrophosphate synthase
MTMRSVASPLFRPIERELEGVEARLAEAAAHPHPVVRAVLEDALLGPGKRLRPALTVACGKLFGRTAAPLTAMAAAVEFLHAATLIHDDVVDQSASRRGEPTLYSVFGNAVAILAGDYLFAQAAVTATDTHNLRIIRLFADCVRTLSAGQIDESSRSGTERYELDRAAYYRTIEAKTAALFVLACESGAILGEATLEQAEALRRYGRLLGLAFQIVDDILDITGDQELLGKPVGSDLRQGVLTLPMIYLRDEVPTAILEAAFAENGEREAAIVQISTIARESAAIARCYDEARGHVQEAIVSLDGLPEGEAHGFLLDVAASVIDRRS